MADFDDFFSNGRKDEQHQPETPSLLDSLMDFGFTSNPSSTPAANSALDVLALLDLNQSPTPLNQINNLLDDLPTATTTTTFETYSSPFLERATTTPTTTKTDTLGFFEEPHQVIPQQVITTQVNTFQDTQSTASTEQTPNAFDDFLTSEFIPASVESTTTLEVTSEQAPIETVVPTSTQEESLSFSQQNEEDKEKDTSVQQTEENVQNQDNIESSTQQDTPNVTVAASLSQEEDQKSESPSQTNETVVTPPIEDLQENNIDASQVTSSNTDTATPSEELQTTEQDSSVELQTSTSKPLEEPTTLLTHTEEESVTTPSQELFIPSQEEVTTPSQEEEATTPSEEEVDIPSTEEDISLTSSLTVESPIIEVKETTFEVTPSDIIVTPSVTQELNNGANSETSTEPELSETPENPQTTTSKEVPPELKCAHCNNIYTTPKLLLPCLDTFCLKCISEFTKGTQLQVFVVTLSIALKHCPVCKTEIELPLGGVASLPDDFMANSILGVASLKEEKATPCDMCDETGGDAAVVYCKVNREKYRNLVFLLFQECTRFLCNDHTNTHKKDRVTKSHVILTMKEFKEDMELHAKTNKTVFCNKHMNEELKLFCDTCDLAICRDCSVLDHKDHKIAFIKVLKTIYFYLYDIL
jgi:hypothetical protein